MHGVPQSYCYDPDWGALKELSGGNSGTATNLQACTGECDADSQCASGLKCFQRSNGEVIPGCYGPGAGKDWDYCYHPDHPSLIELSGGNDNGAHNSLFACTGECDADSQCAGGLKCFQRSNGESIPGCKGPGAGPTWGNCHIAHNSRTFFHSPISATRHSLITPCVATDYCYDPHYGQVSGASAASSSASGGSCYVGSPLEQFCKNPDKSSTAKLLVGCTYDGKHSPASVGTDSSKWDLGYCPDGYGLVGTAGEIDQWMTAERGKKKSPVEAVFGEVCSADISVPRFCKRSFKCEAPNGWPLCCGGVVTGYIGGGGALDCAVDGSKCTLALNVYGSIRIGVPRCGQCPEIAKVTLTLEQKVGSVSCCAGVVGWTSTNLKLDGWAGFLGAFGIGFEIQDS